MDLVKAFRLTNKIKAAIVGSGGKTTTMFQIARDFGSSAINRERTGGGYFTVYWS